MLVLALLVVAIYFFVRGLYWLASILMPVLLIATLIINYRVVWDYIKMLTQTVRRDPFMGILFIVMTFLLSPFVVLFLFSKALLHRKADAVIREQQAADVRNNGEYIDFVEITKKDTEPPIELPPIRERETLRPKDENKYDDFFN